MAWLRFGILWLLIPTAAAVGAARTVTITGLGTLQGALDTTYSSVAGFLGVSYGTASRWQSAKMVTSYASPTKVDVISTDMPLRCPETPSKGATPASGTSEACLHLNIWTPDSALPAAPATASLPVMVFFHGGGYTSGSPEQFQAQGTLGAISGGVICVGVAYRLGVFGFLNSDAVLNANGGLGGNLGLQDQRLALQWIQNYIQFFGGDKTRVMIHGQSSGGNSVINHLVQQASWGLFSAAAIQSGANNLITDKTYANTLYSSLLTGTGCPDLPCLLSKTTAEIQTAASNIVGKFWPAIDGITLTGNPADLLQAGSFSKVPILIGTVRDEWYFFMGTKSGGAPSAQYSPSDLDTNGPKYEGITSPTTIPSALWSTCKSIYAAGGSYDYPTSLGSFTQSWWTLQRMLTDRNSGHCSARYAARNLAAGTPSIWMYMMIDGTQDTSTPTGHTSDNNFIFPSSSFPALTANQITQSTQMIKYWVNMAKTGNPNTGPFTGLVSWPAFTTAGDTILLMQQATFTTLTNFRKQACDFWDANYLPYNFQPYFSGPTTTAAMTTALPNGITTTATATTVGQGTTGTGTSVTTAAQLMGTEKATVKYFGGNTTILPPTTTTTAPAAQVKGNVTLYLRDALKYLKDPLFHYAVLVGLKNQFNVPQDWMSVFLSPSNGRLLQAGFRRLQAGVVASYVISIPPTSSLSPTFLAQQIQLTVPSSLVLAIGTALAIVNCSAVITGATLGPVAVVTGTTVQSTTWAGGVRQYVGAATGMSASWWSLSIALCALQAVLSRQ